MSSKENALVLLFNNSGKEIEYQAGETILRSDDTPSGVYMIKSGAVKVYYYAQSGEANIHSIWCEGEIFPVAWAMRHAMLASTFEAMNEVVLLRLSLAEFEQAYESDVNVACDLAQQVTGQFITYVHRVGNLQYSNAYERIIFQLLFLANRFGQKDGDRYVIGIPLTHAVLASMINVSRETASRCIQRLLRRKLVTQEGKTVIITNAELLAKEIKNSNVNVATFNN